jgi:sterol 24-C-methyltransferase
MAQKMTDWKDRLGALRGLLKISDEEYKAFMATYGALFINSPESTLADYENGVPMQGYRQGSSPELEQYYRIIHLLCTLGSVEKMYMPPEIDSSKSVMENQILLEERMAKDLKIAPKSKVLEIGCGCGAIATSMGEISGAEMFGTNIDPSQIEKSWKNPKLKKENFTVGDFNEAFPFPDNSFDAVYAIQPMTYISNHDHTFSEIYRVLKPGGYFGFNDVAALDNYDRDNNAHRLLIQHTRELTAFGGFWHYKYWNDAFKKPGFELLISEEQGAVENIKKEVSLYSNYQAVFSFLSTIKVLPRKIFLLIQRMHANAESYIRAEEQGLIDLNWYAIMRKPK